MDEPLDVDQAVIASEVAALEKLGGQVNWEETEDAAVDCLDEKGYFDRARWLRYRKVFESPL